MIGPLMVIATILFFDILSKGMVNHYLAPLLYCADFPFGGIPVFENFCGGISFYMQYVTNHGMVWGFGAEFQELLVLLRVVLVLGLFLYSIFSSRVYKYRYSLAMITAGGFGNIIDYFLYGHVIDMFHLVFYGYSYPVFNIADISICLGVFYFMITSFTLSKKNPVPC